MKPQNRGPIPNQGKNPPRQIIAQRFEGPIPPPAMLQQFDTIVPGLADRIVKMTEDSLAAAIYNQKVQTDAVSKAMASDSVDKRIGLILGFVLILVCLLVGGFLIYVGKDIAGYGAMISAVALLVGAYFRRSPKPAAESLP